MNSMKRTNNTEYKNQTKQVDVGLTCFFGVVKNSLLQGTI